MTLDEIRAINQAAAYIDGILYLSPSEKVALTTKLFEIAGNPIPPEARANELVAGSPSEERKNG